MTPVADLGELLRGLGGIPFGSWRGVVVSGISTDSRVTRPGDLFVALPGERSHGSRYAADAIARGAVAAVLPPQAVPPDGAPGLLHVGPHDLLWRAAERLYRFPARHLRVHGVTGSNGKTTTALILAHLLRASGRNVASWTTAIVEGAGQAFRPKWTTPPAHELQRFLRAGVDLGATDAVLEVSSHAVAQGRVGGIRFATGIATNLSPDHLDFHETFEEYAATKRRFIESLAGASLAVLNGEDPRVRDFARSASARVLLFGFSDGCDVHPLDVAWEGQEAGIVIEARVPRRVGASGPATVMVLRVRLPLMGRHNVSNCLAAVAAALWAGVEPQVIERALPGLPPPPRRLEAETVGPFMIINDVAMNEASYATVLSTVFGLGPGHVVVVHAIRGHRGPDVNARIGRVLAEWNGRLGFAPVVVTLSRSRLMNFPLDYQVKDDELAAFQEAAGQGGLPSVVHVELEDAIRDACERLQPGGLLLLLGTFGMDDGPALAVRILREKLGLAEDRPRPGYLQQEDLRG